MEKELLTDANLSHALMLMLIGLLSWLGKKHLSKFEDHVKKCDNRAIDNVAATQWMCDAIHSVANKAGVNTPPPPYSRKYL